MKPVLKHHALSLLAQKSRALTTDELAPVGSSISAVGKALMMASYEGQTARAGKLGQRQLWRITDRGRAWLAEYEAARE